MVRPRARLGDLPPNGELERLRMPLRELHFSHAAYPLTIES